MTMEEMYVEKLCHLDSNLFVRLGPDARNSCRMKDSIIPVLWETTRALATSAFELGLLLKAGARHPSANSHST